MPIMSQAVLDLIVAHARKEAPLEACGYLAATDGIICRHYELTNVDQAPDHYAMDPAEQFAAVRDMRRQGLTLAGVYHSHPCTPARPSGEDIRLAFDPELHQVIISLLGAEVDVKSFRIRQGLAAAEPLTIRGAAERRPNRPRAPKPMEDAMQPATSQSNELKDLRGVGCPMNLVKTKVALRSLQAGQILELILDDGPPIRNVPEAARREGHEILREEQRPDGTWTVLICKG